MALERKAFEDTLFALFSDVFKLDDLPAGKEKDAASKGYQDLAAGIADAVKTFVKSGTVKVTSDDKVVLQDGTTGKIDSVGEIT